MADKKNNTAPTDNSSMYIDNDSIYVDDNSMVIDNDSWDDGLQGQPGPADPKLAKSKQKDTKKFVKGTAKDFGKMHESSVNAKTIKRKKKNHIGKKIADFDATFNGGK